MSPRQNNFTTNFAILQYIFIILLKILPLTIISFTDIIQVVNFLRFQKTAENGITVIL
jgi:hypothetical protein